MKYLELYNEYINLLHRQSEIQRYLKEFPKGNISIKKISGKEYHYLQYASFGKKKSEYLRESEVETVRKKLSLREFDPNTGSPQGIYDR